MENSSKTTFCLQNLLFLLLPCLFFFIQYHVVPVTGDVTPYIPIENIRIDCGSSTSVPSLDGRQWFGDVGGKFIPVEQPNNKNKSSVVKLESQLPSSVDPVPYSTARLSYSEFTYSIPLTVGPKFIRFYFHPTSALLHARGEPTLIKEYCLYVDEGQRLNITFTPRPDITDSFAFINGIEVVSMPSDLYYAAAGDEDGVTFTGQAQGTLYTLENNTSFEKMYRINVGGKEISPGDDSEMFRHWLKDNDYVTIMKPSALPVNTTTNLTFSSKIPSFSAPREVYVTARTMGTNKTQNENYILTWEFPVDSGFNYFVRLHFCEFQNEITQQGDRVFEIFLANFTAETQADVIAWSAWRTLYSDAILNGLEIFKLSSDAVLAGPNPDPLPVNERGNSPQSSTNSKKNNKAVFGIVGGLISGFVVLSLLCIFIFCRKMRVKDTEGVLQLSQLSSTVKSSKSTKSRGSSLPSDLCRYFSLAEIKAATHNFDDVFIVGVGGFGNVYKGFFDCGATQVAIKRLNPGSQQGAHEFRTEIEMLSQLRHVHLVSLIGYCNDGSEMILVYDYMANGTLRDHLYNTENPPLPWKQRLEICFGAAIGLQYLHSGAKHTIIHRDVKTTNILLDEKWVAKVSDFGLSRDGPTNMSQTHVSTVVKGSIGYLDPEYSRRGQLTDKSDEQRGHRWMLWGLQFALQLQELVEEGITPNAGASIEEDVDKETPFTAYAMEDDSGEVFSSIGDHVMNSRSISTFSLTSDEQSFITRYSDKHSSKAVFSEIRDPQGR
ncbi:hypothetical protein F3Y22_tig00110462pilonHSYRG00282 [Hibiscus syriacus]|uniref:Protein kinase domain-containing protein n=1 Tax=Hibiscus syriacus TaxID=106335 RepID=A0A6A3ALR3_HIBSY|nr:hypothetical protein F3Y22_tig00110462pilonHSYRG00282 [Hibiscus syriacus]